MKELIIVKPEKCVGCASCIRTCPAPEANITRELENGKFITTIDPAHCIACGECVSNCPHGARDYIDDTTEVMDSIQNSSQKYTVIVAPAIKSVFPDKWKSILDWFKAHHCEVYDVAYGADICTWAHLTAIKTGMIKNSLITQPCAAIVKYIETYQPKLLQNLSPIHSPMLCEAIFIKKYMRKNAPIIALSPCVAKKNEFDETQIVDYNVTFKKLMEYFELNGIMIQNDYSNELQYEFSGEQGQVGGIYPRGGGLRDNLWLHDPELNITNIEGVQNVYDKLDKYVNTPENVRPQIFDVLSCEFGCNVGAGTGSKKSVFEGIKTMRDVEIEAKKRRKTSGIFGRGAEDKLFKSFDEDLNIRDFMRTYAAATPTRVPTDAELEPIFEKMGKHTQADREYNCHACGYRSCKEMAIAISRGLNTPENCMVFAKNKLVAKHSDLNRENERLEEIKLVCKELSEKLKNDVDGISNNMGTIREANKDTDSRSERVHDLLSNVVAFCEQNDSLDADSTQQLIQILRTTLEAFDDLNTSVKKSTGTTLSVDAYVLSIGNLVDKINNTLDT